MKYCKHTTENHPLSRRHTSELELINEIFKREGLRKEFFVEEVALNLDKVESCRCIRDRRSPESTMDMAIGLNKNDRICKMLLVDAKFNVSNPINLEKKEIDKKIKYSIALLSQDMPIHESRILLFKNDTIQKARSVISRLYRGKSLKCEVEAKTAEEFKAMYF